MNINIEAYLRNNDNRYILYKEREYNEDNLYL